MKPSISILAPLPLVERLMRKMGQDVSMQTATRLVSREMIQEAVP